MLQSRRLRTLVDYINHLKLLVVNASEEMRTIKERQITYYNRNIEKVEYEFYPNEKVLIQNKLTYTWLPKEVNEKTKFL